MKKKISLLLTLIIFISIIILLSLNYCLLVYQGPPGKITIISKNKYAFWPLVFKIDSFLNKNYRGISGIIELTSQIKKNPYLKILNRKKLIDFFWEIIKQ
jgi:hypothetical protein